MYSINWVLFIISAILLIIGILLIKNSKDDSESTVAHIFVIIGGGVLAISTMCAICNNSSMYYYDYSVTSSLIDGAICNTNSALFERYIALFNAITLLKDRTFTCECGFSIDRDLNASLNIKAVGVETAQQTVMECKTYFIGKTLKQAISNDLLSFL